MYDLPKIIKWMEQKSNIKLTSKNITPEISEQTLSRFRGLFSSETLAELRSIVSCWENPTPLMNRKTFVFAGEEAEVTVKFLKKESYPLVYCTVKRTYFYRNNNFSQEKKKMIEIIKERQYALYAFHRRDPRDPRDPPWITSVVADTYLLTDGCKPPHKGTDTFLTQFI